MKVKGRLTYREHGTAMHYLVGDYNPCDECVATCSCDDCDYGVAINKLARIEDLSEGAAEAVKEYMEENK